MVKTALERSCQPSYQNCPAGASQQADGTVGYGPAATEKLPMLIGRCG